jgi:hypothetical protein
MNAPKFHQGQQSGTFCGHQMAACVAGDSVVVHVVCVREVSVNEKKEIVLLLAKFTDMSKVHYSLHSSHINY